MEKTNVMRILEQKKIPYSAREYVHKEKEFIDGVEVAKIIGKSPQQVFKTIVAHFERRYFVCVLPVIDEIDLKKAAKVFRVKNLELIAVKDLPWITGYIRGGCSPIGMKKGFPTIVDKTALLWDTILFSGGKIGVQIEMNPKDLEKVISLTFEDIIKE